MKSDGKWRIAYYAGQVQVYRFIKIGEMVYTVEYAPEIEI